MQKINFANLLTLMRIALIPLFVIVFYLPYSWHYLATAVIFGLAAITDWFDGYIARKYKLTTKLGAFLDPVADKLMVVVALILLVEAYSSAWVAIPAFIIVAREVTVSALREWMAQSGLRDKVSVSYIGKIKTTLQMAAITGLLAVEPGYDHFVAIGSALLLYVAVGLTIWSMLIYLKAAWPELRSDGIIMVVRDSQSSIDEK